MDGKLTEKVISQDTTRHLQDCNRLDQVLDLHLSGLFKSGERIQKGRRDSSQAGIPDTLTRCLAVYSTFSRVSQPATCLKISPCEVQHLEDGGGSVEFAYTAVSVCFNVGCQPARGVSSVLSAVVISLPFNLCLDLLWWFTICIESGELLPVHSSSLLWNHRQTNGEGKRGNGFTFLKVLCVCVCVWWVPSERDGSHRRSIRSCLLHRKPGNAL